MENNLLFICGNIHPSSSQGVRYINLLPELAKHINITLLSYNDFYENTDVKKVFLVASNHSENNNSNHKKSKLSWLKNIYKKFFRPFIFPDRYKFEIPKYKEAISELMRKESFDKVVIAMTPFSLYELAPFIKKNYNIEVICDLSDPFSFNGNHEYSKFFSSRMISNYEIEKLNYVDKVVVLNHSIKRLYEDIVSNTKVNVIEQGLNVSSNNTLNNQNKRFKRLIYAGGLYHKFREAFHLYDAINEYQGSIRLDIYGNIKDDLLPENDFCTYHGLIKSSELSKEYVNSDCIVFIDNNHGYQVPGKVLEIQQFGLPILFIYSNPNSPSLDYLFNDNIIKCINRKTDIMKAIDKLSKINSTRPSEKLNDFSWKRLSINYFKFFN
jgi:hypothetical protein